MSCSVCSDTKWVTYSEQKAKSALANDLNATPCPACKRQEIVDAIHDGHSPVYHDGKTYYAMHHGIRYNLTKDETGDLPSGKFEETVTIAILHGWERILEAVGLKKED